VAAIDFSGKLTRNGWLPLPGRVTRIVVALGECGATPTGGSARGAAIPGSIVPPGSKLTSCVEDSVDSGAGEEAESAKRAFAEYSDPRVSSVDFSSGGKVSPGLPEIPDSFALVAAGVEV